MKKQKKATNSGLQPNEVKDLLGILSGKKFRLLSFDLKGDFKEEKRDLQCLEYYWRQLFGLLPSIDAHFVICPSGNIWALHNYILHSYFDHGSFSEDKLRSSLKIGKLNGLEALKNMPYFHFDAKEYIIIDFFINYKKSAL